MIIKCEPCKQTPAAKYQDEKYNKQMRVHNQIKTPDKTPLKYRCTVCGAIHENYNKV